jgi:peptidoglycan/LPS O-acetylase OafA/YrhL
MKLPAIDALRGIAALGVTWFHSRVDLWVGFREIQANPASYSWIDGKTSWLSLPASQMSGMVMLFFVLSGFCIHLPTVGKNRMPNWKAYAVRRFFRIYPAYLGTLLISFGLALALSKKITYEEINVYAASVALLQNCLFEGQQISINPSLWSIPVEAEFYVVYPLLIWISLRFGYPGAILFTLLCTGCGGILFFSGFDHPNGNFFKYALLWNSGAWLAERYAGSGLPKWSFFHAIALLIGIAVTLFASFAGVNTFYLHYGWGFCSLLVLWWALGPGAPYFAPSKWWVQLLVFLGMISYSVYLLHFPLFRLAGAAWVSLYGSKPDSFFIPTLATALIVPIAWMFYKFIERPSQEFGQRLARQLERGF